MSFNNNAQEHKFVRAIELSDSEMEKVSGGSSDGDSIYLYKKVRYKMSGPFSIITPVVD